MNDNLFLNSSNELTSANIIQQQISQKEFEIQLVDINSRYLTSQDASSYYYNQQKKQLLEIEISGLKIQRDEHINAALMYALTLAEKELMEHTSFSSASIIIANICSFLKIQSIPFTASLPVFLKISTLHSRLQTFPLEFTSLKRELANLKIQLGVP